MTSSDKLTEYGWSFQVKAIAAMFSDRGFMQQIADIIQPEYFESDANIWILEVILNHFKEYKQPPSKDVLKVKITDVTDSVLKVAILEQLKEILDELRLPVSLSSCLSTTTQTRVPITLAIHVDPGQKFSESL